MNARTNLASADLTTPLLSPEILSSFEALSEGRCTLSELNRSVLEACRDDPAATAGVLLLLEGYSNSGELDQQDFGPLKRELERHQGIRDPVLEIEVEPGQDLARGTAASRTSTSNPGANLVRRRPPRMTKSTLHPPTAPASASTTSPTTRSPCRAQNAARPLHPAERNRPRRRRHRLSCARPQPGRSAA